jgi:hypothetical protein
VTTSDVDRFVIALRKGLEPGRAANVAAHLSLGLVAAGTRRGDDWLDRMSFADFPDADGRSHEPISTLGAIVLTGRPGWLRTLKDAAVGLPVLAVDFTELMTVGSADEQLRAMARTPEADLNYYGIGLFGPASVINPFTGKFSLYS